MGAEELSKLLLALFLEGNKQNTLADQAERHLHPMITELFLRIVPNLYRA